MAVKIRLRRMGSSRKPFFRIVAADTRSSNTGSFLEQIGWYDPKRAGVNYLIRMDRFAYWQGNGAQVSDTVDSLVRKCRATGEGVAGAETSVNEPTEVEAPAVVEAAAEPEPEKTPVEESPAVSGEA